MGIYKYDSKEPDKKKFLLDMLDLTMKENFEIGERLKEQANLLNALGHIACKVGHIKQDANGQIYDLAKKMDIKMDINARHNEFSMMRFYGEDN